jgi:hypothetical protein
MAILLQEREEFSVLNAEPWDPANHVRSANAPELLRSLANKPWLLLSWEVGFFKESDLGSEDTPSMFWK